VVASICVLSLSLSRHSLLLLLLLLPPPLLLS
jgi:hypothetical protein